MSNGKRLTIISLIIIGTPLLGMGISALGGAIHSPDDRSGLAAVVGLGTGILGAVGSLVLGPIVVLLTKDSKSSLRSLLGYIIPSVLALLYVTVLSIFLPSGF